VLALKVFREYDPEVVIGSRKPASFPEAVRREHLQRDFASIAITRGGSVIAGPPRLGDRQTGGCSWTRRASRGAR